MKLKLLTVAVLAAASATAFAQRAPYDPRLTDEQRAEQRAEQQRQYDARVSVNGAPITQKAGDSGPGAIDRTRPGNAQSGFSPSDRDAGTSSAGSP